MTDVKDATSLLHYTDLQELDELDDNGAFSEGMRPKVAAIARAIEGGVPRVHIVQSSRVGAIIEEVFTTDGCGTLVVRSKAKLHLKIWCFINKPFSGLIHRFKHPIEYRQESV